VQDLFACRILLPLVRNSEQTRLSNYLRSVPTTPPFEKLGRVAILTFPT
jgi:hypothetical protein